MWTSFGAVPGIPPQFRQYIFFLFTYLNSKLGPGTRVIATGYPPVARMGNAANHQITVGRMADVAVHTHLVGMKVTEAVTV